MFCLKTNFPSATRAILRTIFTNDSFQVEKLLLLLSAPCITPSRSIFLLSLRPFRGRRRRDKISLPYRVPIKIGYQWQKTAGRRRSEVASRERRRGSSPRKNAETPRSPSRSQTTRRGAAQISAARYFKLTRARLSVL